MKTQIAQQQETFKVRIHMDDIDMTDPTRAHNVAASASLAALDRHLGFRAWFTETTITGSHFETTFTPMKGS